MPYPSEKGVICMSVKEKKAYVPPQLTVHGTVEDITLGCDKQLGESDGFTFQGLAIVCES
jgi:hypothetical protein